MSLEVDRGRDGLIPQDPPKPAYSYSEQKATTGSPIVAAEDHTISRSIASKGGPCNRWLVGVLSLASIFATVLAIVAAGVGGSIAVQRKHR